MEGPDRRGVKEHLKSSVTGKVRNGPKSKLSKIRNIRIIAHIDAGENDGFRANSLLCGKSYKMEVHDGEAVMDWMPQEQERGSPSCPP